MKRSPSIEIETFQGQLKDTTAGKVAFIYHLTINDEEGYKKWLSKSKDAFDSERLFRVKSDPAPREGMSIDEILIDEFPSAHAASAFIEAFDTALKQVCIVHAVLAIAPEPSITFRVVRIISWFVRLFKGITDKGVPTTNWSAENTAVWPDENQMRVARSQHLDEPLFVYNLNKYRPIAIYSDSGEKTRPVSGRKAYDRYSKIAGFELLRRGAYPVYGGMPVCLFVDREDGMLSDHWDHFIFVRYPQRRNLLATIESDAFHNGQVHRDAGLERVAIFMARKA